MVPILNCSQKSPEGRLILKIVGQNTNTLPKVPVPEDTLSLAGIGHVGNQYFKNNCRRSNFSS